jgi:hypothetical protein
VPGRPYLAGDIDYHSSVFRAVWARGEGMRRLCLGIRFRSAGDLDERHIALPILARSCAPAEGAVRLLGWQRESYQEGTRRAWPGVEAITVMGWLSFASLSPTRPQRPLSVPEQASPWGPAVSMKAARASLSIGFWGRQIWGELESGKSMAPMRPTGTHSPTLAGHLWRRVGLLI